MKGLKDNHVSCCYISVRKAFRWQAVPHDLYAVRFLSAPVKIFPILLFSVLLGFHASSVHPQVPQPTKAARPSSRVHPLKPLRDACDAERHPVRRQLCWRTLVQELVRFNREHATRPGTRGDYVVDPDRHRLLNALQDLEQKVHQTWLELQTVQRTLSQHPERTEREKKRWEILRSRHQRLIRAYARVYARYRARFPEDSGKTPGGRTAFEADSKLLKTHPRAGLNPISKDSVGDNVRGSRTKK